MTELHRVWEPIDVGHLTLRNRVVVTPHGVGWEGNNLPRERQIAYYTERARGGAGLVCVGSIMGMSRGIPDSAPPAVASDPRTVPMFAELAETMHEHGAPVFIQLGEVGVHAQSRGRFDAWGPAWGPSRVPSMSRGVEPAVIDNAYIRELTRDMVRSCENFVEAGVDGVTLHAAHSYLFGQFLSRAYNHRTDAYGGSLENRARLLVNIIREIRAAVGDRLALGVRVSIDEYLGDAGWTPAENEELVDMLAEMGALSHLDVSSGAYHSPQRFVASMAYPTGHLEDHGARIHELLAGRAVMFLVGSYRTLSDAEGALERGVTDVVGMTRAHIADPFLVVKGQRGHEARTHRCVGANECILNLHMQGGVACAVNPRTGRERMWPAPPPAARTSRRVTVIGAGPAGLRAALVATERGHDVTVFEREATVGGHVSVEALLPGRGQVADLTADLATHLADLGVEPHLGEEVTRDLVAATEPDDMVVAIGADWLATGYTPARPGDLEVPGLRTGTALPIDEAIRRAVADPRSLGGGVAIMDETGGWLPFGLAALLADAGVEVSVFGRHDYLGWRLRESHQIQHVMPALVHHGVGLHPQHVPVRLDGPSLRIGSMFDMDTTHDLAADTLVLAATREPRRLDLDLAKAVPAATVRIIGDALSPRSTADAVFDGEQAGWAIGRPTP